MAKNKSYNNWALLDFSFIYQCKIQFRALCLKRDVPQQSILKENVVFFAVVNISRDPAKIVFVMHLLNTKILGDFLRKRFKTGSVSFELLSHLSQRLPEKAVITVTQLSLAEMSFMNFSAYQTLNQGKSSCIVLKINTAMFVTNLKSGEVMFMHIYQISARRGIFCDWRESKYPHEGCLSGNQ